MSGWIDAAMFVDYDNDGDLDISYSGWNGATDRITKIYQNNNGIFTDINAGINLGTRGSLDWGDFDNDGDMDALVGGSNETQALLRIYRNDGGNVFSNAGTITNVIYGCAKWVDYDNDGDLDIYQSSFSQYSYPNGQVHNGFYKNDLSANNSTAFSIDPSTTNTVAALGLGAFDFLDYDNDLGLDLVTSGHKGYTNSACAYIYENITPTINLRPTAPINLTQQLFGDSVVFTWNRGTDTETHANALTYNLKIGTTPNGFDIMNSAAMVSGESMKISKRGNVGNNIVWHIKGLVPGTYYWSLTSVDNGFNVSLPSAEKSFTITITGVEKNKLLNKFKLYPNPVKNKLNIEFELEDTNNASIFLTDLLGNKVKVIINKEVQNDFYQLNINTSDIPNGTYLLHVDSNNTRSLVRKIIILK